MQAHERACKRNERLTFTETINTDDQAPLPLDELNRRVEADEFHALGRERYQQGDVEDAAAYYQMSLELFPTAEAHIGLGMALAARGSWDAAIAQCDQAIALAPDKGNAYNDRGAYLLELGQLDDALASLKQAADAPDYDCRAYPYYHMALAFERQGKFGEARDAAWQSLQIEPSWTPALHTFRRLLGWLN